MQLNDKEETKKIEWSSIQKMIFGYTDKEIEYLDDEAIDELEKELEITKNDKFPTLTRAMLLNQRKTENYLDELESNFGDGEE